MKRTNDTLLYDEPVRDVLAGRLARPHNLHDLAAVQPVVSRDGVVLLDARQLRLPQLVPLQEDRLFLRVRTAQA